MVGSQTTHLSCWYEQTTHHNLPVNPSGIVVTSIIVPERIAVTADLLELPPLGWCWVFKVCFPSQTKNWMYTLVLSYTSPLSQLNNKLIIKRHIYPPRKAFLNWRRRGEVWVTTWFILKLHLSEFVWTSCNLDLFYDQIFWDM